MIGDESRLPVHRYVLVTFFCALSVPILSFLLIPVPSDSSPLFRQIADAHGQFPALYIIDLIPLIAALAVWIITRQAGKRLEIAIADSTRVQEQSQLLEFTLDSIDQGIIVRDSKGDITLFNHRLSELTGVDAQVYARNASEEEIFEIQGSAGITGAVSPEIKTLIEDWNKRLKENGTAEKLSYIRQVPSGMWLLATRQVLKSGHEVRTFLDITDQKLAEDEAIGRAVILQHTLDNMGQGLTMYDSNWNLRAFNKRYQEHFDLPEDTLLEATTFDDVVGATMRRDYGDDEADERLKIVRDPGLPPKKWSTFIVS
jgi:PAS domain-containing protein